MKRINNKSTKAGLQLYMSVKLRQALRRAVYADDSVRSSTELVNKILEKEMKARGVLK